VPVSGAAFYLGDRYVGRGAAPRAAIEAPVGRPSSMPTEVVETPAPEGGAPGTEETAPVAPTTPANPQRRRVAPETVTDDFSQMSSGLPSAAALGAARPTQTAITGIVLDAGARLPSPTELARRVLPSPTANSSPNTTADEPAPRTTAAIPIAARPDDLNGSQSGEAETSVRNGVELPPPQIGPMSLRLAAQNGDPGAQFEVAARFADAKGVKQDFAQALIWYQRAAQKGFVPAQYRLATLLERGVAGGADLPRAKLWYKRAAEQGNTKAMHNLAVIATSENPQKPDYLTAARLFTDAAERGLADSQYNLAVLYDTGLGVGRDPMQAYKWYALAARSGDTDAAKRRDQVFAGLTPGQTRDAERSVEQFRAKFADPKANDPRAASAAWQAEQAQLRDRGERLAAEGRPRLDQAEASPNPAAPAPQPTAQRAQPKITTRPVPMPKPMP
jgi:localization factor PodJL